GRRGGRPADQGGAAGLHASALLLRRAGRAVTGPTFSERIALRGSFPLRRGQPGWPLRSPPRARDPRMKKVLTARALCLIVTMMVACGGRVNIGGPGTPGSQQINAGDPAEQSAIQMVKGHGGYVTHDDTQPNRPVIEVSIFQASFTDANL